MENQLSAIKYDDYVSSKKTFHEFYGFEAESLNPNLFDWQADIVRWALRKGRACIFEDCGLGKTIQQLAWAEQIPGQVLILTPLAVAEQTAIEAERFGIDAHVSRDGTIKGQITITNYEQMHRFDLDSFTGIVLDESSILKAQTGNTYPGACAPFGMFSACAYSGAYPTGYGTNAPNTHATPPQRFERLVASGFTHLQQSGTGAIETYYNYVRVTPLTGNLAQFGTQWALTDEQASPGYYAATLDGTGIRAELTASRRAALHRYTFPSGSQARIVVDFSTGGIDFPRMRTLPTDAKIALTAPNVAQGAITMAGMRLYVYVETDTPLGSSTLWLNKRELNDTRLLTLPHIDETNLQPFGVVFNAPPKDHVIHVQVGVSLRSVEQALSLIHI